MENEKELEFEIVEELATLSENGNWKKQLNIVKWGDNIAKYEIRSWRADYKRVGKGITLTIEEIKNLKRALNNLEEI